MTEARVLPDAWVETAQLKWLGEAENEHHTRSISVKSHAGCIREPQFISVNIIPTATMERIVEALSNKLLIEQETFEGYDQEEIDKLTGLIEELTRKAE